MLAANSWPLFSMKKDAGIIEPLIMARVYGGTDLRKNNILGKYHVSSTIVKN